MEETIRLKFIISILSFAILIVAGFLLHRTGKPYNQILFNIHKLISLLWIVLMVMMVIHEKGNLAVPILQIAMISSIVAVLALLVSGGMMSLDKLHETMLMVHRIATGAVLICTPVILYILFFKNSVNAA